MVTAILIPLIIFYFYWLSKKERKQKVAEWENIVYVEEHSRLIGEVHSISKLREKFYQSLFLDIYVLEVKQNGKIIITMRKVPANSEQPHYEEFLHKKVTIYGRWEEDNFLINRIVSLS